MKNIKELAREHNYYCSESNYYSNEASGEFETASDFLDKYESCDVDLNLCFRWDIIPCEDEKGNETGNYSAMVFIIKQRKGIFSPITINHISEKEIPRFYEYLKLHKSAIDDFWSDIG